MLCPADCGPCAPPTTTTTLPDPTTTTTLADPTTTTTLPDPTTTTTVLDTTTTTLTPQGACCHGAYCSVTTESLCEGEDLGSYAGDGSTCDGEVDDCVLDTTDKNGDPCEDESSCTVAGSGVCTDGSCVGAGTTLSPSCRWIIVGASPDGPVNVRSGKGWIVDANACGDTAKSAGITTASIVATAAAHEGIHFYGPPEVVGDIVTGGATVGASLYVLVPGTNVKTVAGGTTLAKMPSGTVDTTGNHSLVDVCVDDKAALILAAPTLDAMPATGTAGGIKGLKIPSGGSDMIDVTGDGVAVIDVDTLKVGYGGTLTLKGSASDVIMLRVTDGGMTLGYGSQLVLDGLLYSNVLLYGQGSRCRLAPGVVGGGTVFCPEAGKFVVGVGTDWTGTFLGGVREVQVRHGAVLTHEAFTGF